MNLLQKTVGAINKQIHSFMLLCFLTTAAAGKRNMEVVAGFMTQKYQIMLL
jgi:hypothetical protein